MPGFGCARDFPGDKAVLRLLTLELGEEFGQEAQTHLHTHTGQTRTPHPTLPTCTHRFRHFLYNSLPMPERLPEW